MCGGHGSRFDSPTEKPLFEIGGVPMIDRVLGALEESTVETVMGAVSPNAPETKRHLESRPVPCFETPGDGYVEDLQYITENHGSPFLSVAADLPLLDSTAVDSALESYSGGSLAVYTTVERKSALGLSVDTSFRRDGAELVPTGMNIVGEGEETTCVTEDVSLAVNVNRPRDARVAEAIL